MPDISNAQTQHVNGRKRKELYTLLRGLFPAKTEDTLQMAITECGGDEDRLTEWINRSLEERGEDWAPVKSKKKKEKGQVHKPHTGDSAKPRREKQDSVTRPNQRSPVQSAEVQSRASRKPGNPSGPRNPPRVPRPTGQVDTPSPRSTASRPAQQQADKSPIANLSTKRAAAPAPTALAPKGAWAVGRPKIVPDGKAATTISTSPTPSPATTTSPAPATSALSHTQASVTEPSQPASEPVETTVLSHSTKSNTEVSASTSATPAPVDWDRPLADKSEPANSWNNSAVESVAGTPAVAAGWGSVQPSSTPGPTSSEPTSSSANSTTPTGWGANAARSAQGWNQARPTPTPAISTPNPEPEVTKDGVWATKSANSTQTTASSWNGESKSAEAQTGSVAVPSSTSLFTQTETSFSNLWGPTSSSLDVTTRPVVLPQHLEQLSLDPASSSFSFGSFAPEPTAETQSSTPAMKEEAASQTIVKESTSALAASAPPSSGGSLMPTPSPSAESQYWTMPDPNGAVSSSLPSWDAATATDKGSVATGIPATQGQGRGYNSQGIPPHMQMMGYGYMGQHPQYGMYMPNMYPYQGYPPYQQYGYPPMSGMKYGHPNTHGGKAQQQGAAAPAQSGQTGATGVTPQYAQQPYMQAPQASYGYEHQQGVGERGFYNQSGYPSGPATESPTPAQNGRKGQHGGQGYGYGAGAYNQQFY